MFTLSTTVRVLSVLSFAVLPTRVAGQWSGNFNTTSVRRGDPPERCWIQGLNGTNVSLQPCTCTGGTVAADCNWLQGGYIFNRVSDSVCTCPLSTENFPDGTAELQEFTRNQPQGVRGCLCDRPEGGVGAGPLVTSGPECWCPSQFIAEKSGLSEATQDAPTASAPELGGVAVVPGGAGAPVDSGSVQSCAIDWPVFPDGMDCVCTDPAEQQLCPSNRSGKRVTALKSARCICESGSRNANDLVDFTITGCICTSELQDGKRDRCICVA